MRSHLILAAASCSLAVTGCGGRPTGVPDVLLITVDTLRADRLGCYGHSAARTPVIDALAARGVRFDQATTPFPRTTPAIASLLSGLWPPHHGSREVAQPMGDAPLLAEILKGRGYATVGVAANGTVGKAQNLHRGFDAFVAGFPNPRLGGAAALTTAQALAYVDGVPPDRALFLWVHYLDPHFPYLPPEDWPDQPPATLCRELATLTIDRRGPLFADRGGVASAALPACHALYDSEVAYTDAEIGRLLQGLEARGRDPRRAVVVFTSDHGENLGEWGLYYEHGPNLHDASLRVPLLLAGPGIEPGTDGEVARLEDVLPTLLRLLEVPEEELPALDGVDLAGRLRGGRSPPLVAFAESGSALHVEMHDYLSSGRADGTACTNDGRFSLCGGPGSPLGLFDRVADPDLVHDLARAHPEDGERLQAIRRRWPPEKPRQRAVRTERFKLVERPLPEGGYRGALYDHRSDPDELHDLRAEHPGVAERLERLLHRWAEQAPPAELHRRSDEALEALRSLGYIE